MIATITILAIIRVKKCLHWSSKTDFQVLLACRWASEEQSITGALIRELQYSNKDVVAIISFFFLQSPEF